MKYIVKNWKGKTIWVGFNEAAAKDIAFKGILRSIQKVKIETAIGVLYV